MLTRLACVLGMLSLGAACSSAPPSVAPPQGRVAIDAPAPPADASIPDATPTTQPPQHDALRPFVEDWEGLYRSFDDQRAAPVGSFACDRRVPPELGPNGQPRVICSPRSFLVAARVRRAGPVEGSGEIKVMLDRGRDDGVESTWRGVFVDGQGLVVSESAPITSLGPRESLLLGPIPRDIAERHRRVVLFPPSVQPPRPAGSP
jgi:hypothetical protein